LHLERLDRDALKPTYTNGGVWLSPVGSNLSVAVRLFRCILNHAPIGLYYECFNIPEPLACDCGFIARIVTMSFSRVTNTREKPIGVLII